MSKEKRADQPTAAEIVQAIERSGFLMEQRVASSFESLGFNVQTGYPFEDPEEGKSREIDVWAVMRGTRDEARKVCVWLEMICECKNNENPFVFLRRPKGHLDNLYFDPCQYVLPFSLYQAPTEDGHGTREQSGFRLFGFHEFHYWYRDSTRATQFCKILRKGDGWEANQGGIYDAIFYPLAKAATARRVDRSLYSPRDPSEWKNIYLLFPVVVVNGKIYQIDSTLSVPEPLEVGHVSFVRSLTSKRVKGQFMIDFVTQAELGTYVKSIVLPYAEDIGRLAIDAGDRLGKSQ